MGEQQKTKFEERIKELEQQLITAQKGKTDHTDLLLENRQLQKKNKESEQECKVLKERLQNVEQDLSNKMIELQDKDDKLAGFVDQVHSRDKQLQHMEEKNK